MISAEELSDVNKQATFASLSDPTATAGILSVENEYAKKQFKSEHRLTFMQQIALCCQMLARLHRRNPAYFA